MEGTSAAQKRRVIPSSAHSELRADLFSAWEGAGGSSVLFEHQAEAELAGSILRGRGAFPVPWR